MAEEFLSFIFAFPNPFSTDFITALDDSDGFGTAFLLPEDEFRDMIAMYLMFNV